jgi:MFS family permease
VLTTFPAANSNGRIWVRTTGEADPIDPKNWPLLSRSKNIGILVLLIFTQGWAGSADSQANERASREFGVSQIAQNLSTAMYLFGIGSGSLFAGPLSESIGRNPTYLVSTFIYLLFVLGSALTPTFAGQVICRYFVGLFSSPTLSINGSSVGDQFRPVKRAFVFPMIAWANIAGMSPAKAKYPNTNNAVI